jgi:uncharacterized protein YjlB
LTAPAIRIETLQFADGGDIPNSRLPLVVYRSAIAPERAGAEALEELFGKNGWPPRWRAQIYTFHHYHSSTHETLGIARGTARVMFGGKAGKAVDVRAGDVVVIPAGVGHKRLDSSAQFLVVGAYPPGADWDLLRGEKGERPRADENIARVKLPVSDPVEGTAGTLTKLWR